jgi:hypothetical protein
VTMSRGWCSAAILCNIWSDLMRWERTYCAQPGGCMFFFWQRENQKGRGMRGLCGGRLVNFVVWYHSCVFINYSKILHTSCVILLSDLRKEKKTTLSVQLVESPPLFYPSDGKPLIQKIKNKMPPCFLDVLMYWALFGALGLKQGLLRTAHLLSCL